jgi:drug/metabolite transporter (DMT)-like permease
VIPSRQPNGLWWGLLGVAAFSFTVPFTKVAVAGFSPLFIGSARAVMAAALRARERPPAAFWAATAGGALAAMIFAFTQSGGFGQLHWADLLFLGAVVAAAVGYAEGGLLARELGAWQTVSWALVLASPLMVFLTALSAAHQPPSGTKAQWAALAYLGVVSMFLGFFAWYRGLAIGPMAQVSQTQLIQPVLSICWAGLLLGETLGWTTVIGGLAVILCAGAAVRVRLSPPPVTQKP